MIYRVSFDQLRNVPLILPRTVSSEFITRWDTSQPCLGFGDARRIMRRQVAVIQPEDGNRRGQSDRRQPWHRHFETNNMQFWQRGDVSSSDFQFWNHCHRLQATVLLTSRKWPLPSGSRRSAGIRTSLFNSGVFQTAGSQSTMGVIKEIKTLQNS